MIILKNIPAKTRMKKNKDSWQGKLAHHIRELNAMYINLNGGFHMEIKDVSEFYRKTIEWDNPANYDEEE